MTDNDPRAATTAHTRHIPVRRGTFELRGVHAVPQMREDATGGPERPVEETP
jgi:hypothetical protein